jgi:hypothetical protein
LIVAPTGTTAKPSGAKGYALEEALRNYFLLTGLYVVRGVPVRLEDGDLTDIDLWLCERSSGSSRRRLIVDAKFRNRPKAVERLFWTKGLSQFLGVDGAYVATTDARQAVRAMARKIGLSVLDGNDLSRIAGNAKTGELDRLTEEEFLALVRRVDQARHSRDWSMRLDDAKAGLAFVFGAASANRALSAVAFFAEQAAVAPAFSEQARIAVRLAFFCASLAAISIDYVSSEAAFRPLEDRSRLILNVIRYGHPDRETAMEKVRLASALVENFAENGAALGHQVVNRYEDDVSRIPAEIIADHITRMSPRELLFNVSRELEEAAYSRSEMGFDALPPEAKALMAVFLDFVGIARAKFAAASPTKRLGLSGVKEVRERDEEAQETPAGPLFDRPK